MTVETGDLDRGVFSSRDRLDAQTEYSMPLSLLAGTNGSASHHNIIYILLLEP